MQGLKPIYNENTSSPIFWLTQMNFQSASNQARRSSTTQCNYSLLQSEQAINKVNVLSFRWGASVRPGGELIKREATLQAYHVLSPLSVRPSFSRRSARPFTLRWKDLKRTFLRIITHKTARIVKFKGLPSFTIDILQYYQDVSILNITIHTVALFTYSNLKELFSKTFSIGIWSDFRLTLIENFNVRLWGCE